MGGRLLARPPKILILYATAGHGHERAAKAVLEVCKRRGWTDAQALDTLKHTRYGFGPRYRTLYFFLIQKAPWLWGFFYGLTDLAWVYFLLRPLRRLVNHGFAADLERLILKESPDVVISTHFLASEVTGYLKRRRRLTARLFTVITDYASHAFWIVPETDGYAVATERTASELVSRGVGSGRVFVTGIPIEPKFAEARPRDLLVGLLGLRHDRFTVLVTSGGAAVGMLGPLTDRLLLLEPPLQVLVVCGTNHALRAALEAKHHGRPELRLFGFVDNIHELMTVSDVVVGKGGGLTLTESLVIGRPMVLYGAVPGQETRNVERIVGHRAAWRADSIPDAIERVVELRRNRVLYTETVREIEKIRSPHAAERVVEHAAGR
jgi:processive 1,2-diacylglycerol beta-glucosyltransferase